jgi:hypothetical protein
MPTLREIFALPEHVGAGDFVLKLTDGLTAPEETVRQYVVTPQLVKCFDQALGVVKAALDARASKGAYLHGSFGAGKSHFMAMLTLLLRNEVIARSKPELAPIVSKHNAWTQNRRFLVVPYHMQGAQSMEAALFGGYAQHIATVHPHTPTPGFYQRDGILADAQTLRGQMGDEAFFQALNQADQAPPTGGGPWGKVATCWHADSFAAGLNAPPGSNNARFQLVGALVRAFYSTQRQLSASEEELYTSLDDGLAAMAHHAQDLGYDAVVLFLDEFILWLASRAADTAWLGREGQKVAKLVESGNADRPIPIISFMARQRDLRELIGEHLPGAEQLSISDTLQFFEARFDRVNLEDRNLPEIAKKRLLRPRDTAAEAQLQHAVHKLLGSQPQVLQTLLTREGDQQMLKDLYPFTPALVQTLIAVSSLLQRERTALKLMLQMLVERADSMQIGEIIPVGDLFDVIAAGDEPFTHGIKLLFEQAKQLWRRRLLPLLEAQHGLTWQDSETATDSPKANALRNDARLLKTLVLAALTPEVDALKNLTPAKLAALNHGSIRTPVPGSEGVTVLNKLKRWAGQAGEIKIADDSPNPTVALEIAKVDTDAILANALSFDTQGNRQAEVRQRIVDGLNLTDTGSSLLPPELDIVWRGSRRKAEIVFGNIREQSFETLKGREGIWRILVDFPFDQPPHGPRDDIAKLESFLDDGGIGRSLVWLPSFFTPNVQDQLGRLVVIDFVLRGNHLEQYAAHLSQADREQARLLLTNQRDQLRQFVRNSLHSAYGLNTVAQEALDPEQSIDEHVYALDPTLNLRPPVAATFKDAFEKLLEQALDYEFPAHPKWDTEPRPIAVKRLAEVLTQAAQQPAGRIELEAALRDDARRLLPKLELADVGEAALQVRDDWSQHFARELARRPGRDPTIADLRDWLDQPQRRGLREDVQDLVILSWLAKTNRSLYRFGQPYQGHIGQLAADCEAREQPLPLPAEWEQATERAAELFDPLLAGLYRSAPGLAQFSLAVRKWIKERGPHLAAYVRVLEQLMAATDAARLSKQAALRQHAAVGYRDWLAALETAADLELVRLTASQPFDAERLAEAKAVFASVAKLAPLKLTNPLAHSLQQIAAGGGEFAPRAHQVLENVIHALLRYEYVEPLADAIVRFEQEANALLIAVANRPVVSTPATVTLATVTPVMPTPVPDRPVAARSPQAGQRIERTGLGKAAALAALAEARAALEVMESAQVDLHIVIRAPHP